VTKLVLDRKRGNWPSAPDCAPIADRRLLACRSTAYDEVPETGATFADKPAEGP